MPAPLLCTHVVCYMPAWPGSFDDLPCHDVRIKLPHSCLWATQTFITWIFNQLLTVVFRLFLISLMNRAALNSPETRYFFIRVYAHAWACLLKFDRCGQLVLCRGHLRGPVSFAFVGWKWVLHWRTVLVFSWNWVSFHIFKSHWISLCMNGLFVLYPFPSWVGFVCFLMLNFWSFSSPGFL